MVPVPIPSLSIAHICGSDVAMLGLLKLQPDQLTSPPADVSRLDTRYMHPRPLSRPYDYYMAII